MTLKRSLAVLVAVFVLVLPSGGGAQTGSDAFGEFSKTAFAALAECESWPPIEEIPPDTYGQTSAGEVVKLGSQKGYHKAFAKYAHVDVTLIYLFDEPRFSIAEVSIQETSDGGRSGYVFRASDGSLFIPFGQLSLTVESGDRKEADKITVSYTLKDGTPGSVTYARKPGTKV